MKKNSKIKQLITISMVVIAAIVGVLLISFRNNEGNGKLNGLNLFLSENANIQFYYPSDLSLEILKAKDYVQITHQISFTGGICANESGIYGLDEKREIGLFDELDFKVRFTNVKINDIYPNFEELVQPGEGGISYLTPIEVGGKNGFYAVKTVEMCGTIEYYFPLDSGTLIVSKDSEAAVLRSMGNLKSVPSSFSDLLVNQIFETIVRTAKPLK